ncbi:MAG: hypothetical protein PUP46_07885 [Endozoicomonas sp. (ex Botrylloides leachii)]|nr:hypothetical protein [Endozoicomonas sp. (ex Botrylloides leachii)]
MAHVTIPPYAPITYTATASQTDFPVPFPFFDVESLKVYRHNAGTEPEESDLLVQGTDYTVTNVENPNQGSDNAMVVLASGATAGDLYTLRRAMTFERTIDYPNSSQPRGDTLNTDFDRLWIATQQNQYLFEQLTGYTIDNPSPSPIPVFPTASAGLGLVWDTTGNVLVNQAFPNEAVGITYDDTSVPFTAANVQVALDQTNVRIDGLAPGGDPLTDSNIADQADLNAGTADQVLDAALIKSGGFFQTDSLNTLTSYTGLTTAPSNSTHLLTPTSTNRPSDVDPDDYVATVLGIQATGSRVVAIRSYGSTPRSFLMLWNGTAWTVKKIATGAADGTITAGSENWISAGDLNEFGLGTQNPPVQNNWNVLNDVNANRLIQVSPSASNLPAGSPTGVGSAGFVLKPSDDRSIVIAVQADYNNPRIVLKIKDTVLGINDSGWLDVPILISSGSNANGNYRVYSDGYKECWFLTSSVVTSWTFPISFTTAPAINLTAVGSGSTSAASVWIVTETLTSVTLSSAFARSFHLFAKGY